MLPFCLMCKTNTENLDPKVLKTKNHRTMLPPTYALSGSSKSRFMKEQEAKGILSSSGLKTLLSKIPLFGEILL